MIILADDVATEAQAVGAFVARCLADGLAPEEIGVFVRTRDQVRSCRPDTAIIVGGQYHAGVRGSALLRRFPEIDCIVAGEGDSLDWEAVLQAKKANKREIHGPANGAGKSSSSQEIDFNWSLHSLDLRQYAPKIEIGRGCPFKCSFCAISGAPTRLSRARISSIRSQLQFWSTLWAGEKSIPLYVECPVFFCTKASIEDYEACFAGFTGKFRWRAAARVDSIDVRTVERLRKLGLSVLDIGLETGSDRMLQLMNKTANPTEYLSRAKRLILAAGQAGIKVKLNILLYAGETRDTVATTIEYIESCKPFVTGVSVGSLIDYPGTALREELPSLSMRFGTRRVHDDVLAAADVYPLHLSKEIDYAEAQSICVKLSQSVMSDHEYFSLKSVGYYPIGFTFNQFHNLASKYDAGLLPFRPDKDASFSKTQPPSEFLPSWDTLR